MLQIKLVLALIITIRLLSVQAAYAAESLRTQEINECLDDELKIWGDGRDRPASSSTLHFSYNANGSPEWFSTHEVLAMVTKASASWSQCGVKTEIMPWSSMVEKQKQIIMVKWDEKESRGNAALANLTMRTLSLNPAVFRLLKSRRPAYDARETLQMAISHEMGHFFGLMAHSRRCIDVLSYYDNGKGEVCFSRDPLWKSRMIEYRSTLPTACDIKRCQKANGSPVL